MIEYWPIELADGTLVSAEPSLASISSYVLIEQEDWFEKEIAFVRRLLQPGMMVVDIGANIGVYSLVMARVVGMEGHVLAAEPLAGPRRHLERSLRLNQLSNLTVRATAVADAAGVGRMRLGPATETASLDAEEGEEVEVTTLDQLTASLTAPPAFIKIDAEGAERRVLAGGRDFLMRHSPILMLEIRTDATVNLGLLTDLQILGFDVYRALPGAQGLVPYAVGSPLDAYELNIFACKKDTAEALERRGMLVREIRAVDLPPLDQAVSALRQHPYATGFPSLFEAGSLSRDGYGKALAAWSLWAQPESSLIGRYPALHNAYNHLAEILPGAPTLARLATMMRIASEAGQRSVVVDVATALFGQATQSSGRLDEPFLPPHPRFDAIPPSGDTMQWLLAAAGEQYEQSRAFSSVYTPTWPGVRAVCNSGYAPTEMFRRLALREILEGTGAVPDIRLSRPAPDHRNVELWRHLRGNSI